MIFSNVFDVVCFAPEGIAAMCYRFGGAELLMFVAVRVDVKVICFTEDAHGRSVSTSIVMSNGVQP